MSLYQKYRPQDFDSFVGNGETVSTLKTALAGKTPPKAYLFTGPSGCGKTTAARIAARMLGADQVMSVTEVNSADNRGIDTARTLIEQMRFSPMKGTARVFIIDEVHMTSKDFQNAMLKPLEEAPDYVFIFLCTTDPQKLIKALVNRCAVFPFSLLSESDLFTVIKRVNRMEQLGFEPEHLHEIAKSADGSPRRALVTMEKLIGVTDDKMRAKILRDGAIDTQDPAVIDLCRELIQEKPSWRKIGPMLKAIYGTEGFDAETVRLAVMGYASAVLVSGQENAAAGIVLECFREPTYSTGKMGITLAAYQSVFAR